MNPAAGRAPESAASPPGRAEVPATAVLLLFAAARAAAGTGREAVSGYTVGEVLDAARARHGDHFRAVLEGSRVWVNGEPAPSEQLLRDGDEIAVLPPVSGGVA
jgi:molybdopterin synthase sulfur carrier subunit